MVEQHLLHIVQVKGIPLLDTMLLQVSRLEIITLQLEKVQEIQSQLADIIL